MKSFYQKCMPSRIYIWKKEAQVKHCKEFSDSDASRDLTLLGSFIRSITVYVSALVTKFQYRPSSVFPRVLLLLVLNFAKCEIIQDKPVLYETRLKQRMNSSHKCIIFLSLVGT